MAEKRKSARKLPGKPFTEGRDSRRGRGPKKGTGGRPTNKWREACRQALVDAEGLSVVKGIISGDIYEEIAKDRDGNPIYGETKNSDRLGAVKFLTAYAEGAPPMEIGEGDDGEGRPRQVIKIGGVRIEF